MKSTESQTIELLVKECNDLKLKLRDTENKLDCMSDDFRQAMAALELVIRNSVFKWDQ